MSAVRLLAAATLARTADSAAGVVVVLASLRQFGSPAQGSLMLAVLLVPHVVAGPLVGLVTDRARHPRLIHACFVAVFGTALGGALSLLGHVPQPLVLGLALLAGCCGSMIFGGLSSRLDDVVAEPRRPRFRGLDAATYNVADIAGPAVGAGLVVAAGVTVAAAVLTTACLSAAVLLLTVRASGGAAAAVDGARRVAEGSPDVAAAKTPTVVGGDVAAATNTAPMVEDERGADVEPAIVAGPARRGGPGTDGGAAGDGGPATGTGTALRSGSATETSAEAGTGPEPGIGSELVTRAGVGAQPATETSAEPGIGAGVGAQSATETGSEPGSRSATETGAGAGTGRGRFWDDLRAGLRAIVVSRPLRAVTAATCVNTFGLGMLPSVVVLLGVTHGHPTGGGLLMTAVGVGALTGSLLVARRPVAMAPHRFVLACLAATGAVLAVVPLVHSWPVLVVLFGVAGLCDGPLLASVLQVRSTEAPPRTRTQVFTLGAGFKLTAAALGAASFAVVASWPVGALAAVVAGTQLVAAAVGGLLLAGRARSTSTQR
ncbi:MFS transporter [Dactylosporangium sp. NPDC048998]|uniref:MFS transporter n=1 Tax=Dactylosporangium sp. NPDC048998 TaxID=3363976 RepID=UPI003717D433